MSRDHLGMQNEDVEDPVEVYRAWESSVLGRNEVNNNESSLVGQQLRSGVCKAEGEASIDPIDEDFDNLVPPMELRPLPQVTANYLQGMAFQQEGLDYLVTVQSDVADEVTVTPLQADGTPAGYSVRLDALGISNANGQTVGTDFKSSENAPLTENQQNGYPLIEANGGIIVGNNGGPAFPDGAIIPPTRVQILRPGDF